jgi:hypothetical protein
MKYAPDAVLYMISKYKRKRERDKKLEQTREVEETNLQSNAMP